ncbi:hypothetical protein [Solimonas variicoloris]|uniref:hypothetical protein n=1 Tax=Solimonas variicoloris TaxID=254408 RepID=UPI0003651F25|nr:hypothetical protein [Solimonas variicoloris]
MLPNRRTAVLALSVLSLSAALPAQADLLGGGDPDKAEAEPFDFDAAMNDPGRIAGDYFAAHRSPQARRLPVDRDGRP